MYGLSQSVREKADCKYRPVGLWGGGGGGSRGSNEPPKIFEVGIFGRLKR